MSDSTTTERPPGEPQEGVPAPPDGAPAEQQPELPLAPQPPEKPPEEAESRFNRRIAEMRSRLSNSERQREEMAQRLAALEARIPQAPQPPIDPQVQAHFTAEVERAANIKRAEERIKAWDEAGREAYPDWEQRKADLRGMGATPLGTILPSIPNGHAVAAALRDNPEAIDEIMGHATQEARAVALGRFAQQIAAAPTRQVSRVPPPPKPVQTRSMPTFNEYQADTGQLLDHYSKQAMDAQRERMKSGGAR